jgi:hypothetical protein
VYYFFVVKKEATVAVASANHNPRFLRLQSFQEIPKGLSDSVFFKK